MQRNLLGIAYNLIGVGFDESRPKIYYNVDNKHQVYPEVEDE